MKAAVILEPSHHRLGIFQVTSLNGKAKTKGTTVWQRLKFELANPAKHV